MKKKATRYYKSAKPYKPVLAFEFVVDKDLHIYYTDGVSLVGPQKGSYQAEKRDYREDQLVIEIVSFIDPDNPKMIYHEMVAAKIFDTKKDAEYAYEHFPRAYRESYEYIINGVFKINDKNRPGFGPILFDSVPISRIRASISSL